jgi:hypothetical protein
VAERAQRRQLRDGFLVIVAHRPNYSGYRTMLMCSLQRKVPPHRVNGRGLTPKE